MEMEMEQGEAEVKAKKIHAIYTKLHFWINVLKFQTLSDSCGPKRNITMTNM